MVSAWTEVDNVAVETSQIPGDKTQIIDDSSATERAFVLDDDGTNTILNKDSQTGWKFFYLC